MLFVFSWPGARAGSKVWNGLHYTIRKVPFSTIELIDADYRVDLSTVTRSENKIAVITTKPLTKNETWFELERGESMMFVKGEMRFNGDCKTLSSYQCNETNIESAVMNEQGSSIRILSIDDVPSLEDDEDHCNSNRICNTLSHERLLGSTHKV